MSRSMVIRHWAPRAFALALALSAAVATARVWSQTTGLEAGKEQAGGASQNRNNGKESRETNGKNPDDVDEVEILQTQVDVKKRLLEIDQARMDQQKKWQAHYERLFRDGRVFEDRLLATKDDLLMMEAHMALAQADVKVAEIRLRQARRRAQSDHPATSGADRRVSGMEQRLTSAEMNIDHLQHEVGRLRREMPRETQAARR